MKRMNVKRIIVIAALLVAFVATSAGTSFAATRSSYSQSYTPPIQSVTIGKLPNGSAANTATFNAQAANAAVGAASFVAALASVSFASLIGFAHPITSNVSSSAQSAFGR